CALAVIARCFLRPGSAAYARENHSYGLATLKKRHVEVRGDLVRFDFPGKSGQRQVRQLRDRRVARVLRELRALPGPTLFNVSRREINAYIKEVLGEQFSAKDFRTWAGCVVFAHAILVEKKKPAEAVRAAAAVLGNTPAVCK